MSEEMNVRRLAGLAKLTLTPEEEIRLNREMKDILAFARQLQETDVGNVPQTRHVLEQTNVLRADEPGECLSRDTVLSAAPAREDGCIAVPRAVE